ncbi:MAG: phosphonoacetaldehyde reductase [Ruminococcus sp.]|nr:phosphonoacetaldehyde reductase [Ruminococcus sp.]
MSEQIILRGNESYSELRRLLSAPGAKKLFLVCGGSLKNTPTGRFFSAVEAEDNAAIVRFSGFSPNPDYDEIVSGVRLFRESGCGIICGAGGGSAIDTAKCIKLFADMPDDRDYVLQEAVPNGIPLIAIPTTAGSGSEATHFAVIYYNGKKFSITDNSCLPQTVLLDPENLATLPDKHRRAAMLDALSHAIESMWSVRSTDESRELSRCAIKTVIRAMDGYVSGDNSCAEDMMDAAFTAGRAINITATTAGHAMSYMLTKMYGLPHGHAVSLCLPEVWRFIAENADKCSDSRGCSHLQKILGELPELLGCEDTGSAVAFIKELPEKLGLAAPADIKPGDIDALAASVNPERLRNTPVVPDTEAIREMYLNILGR